jgi:hypothetical protein
MVTAATPLRMIGFLSSLLSQPVSAGYLFFSVCNKWGDSKHGEFRAWLSILYLSNHRRKSKRRNREERAFAPSSWTAYDVQDEGIRNCDLALF